MSLAHRHIASRRALVPPPGAGSQPHRLSPRARTGSGSGSARILPPDNRPHSRDSTEGVLRTSSENCLDAVKFACRQGYKQQETIGDSVSPNTSPDTSTIDLSPVAVTLPASSDRCALCSAPPRCRAASTFMRPAGQRRRHAPARPRTPTPPSRTTRA